MREAIEKVIAELNMEIGHCEIALGDDYFDYETRAELRVLESVQTKLKEVLSNHEGERTTEHNLPTEKER